VHSADPFAAEYGGVHGVPLIGGATGQGPLLEPPLPAPPSPPETPAAPPLEPPDPPAPPPGLPPAAPKTAEFPPHATTSPSTLKVRTQLGLRRVVLKVMRHSEARPVPLKARESPSPAIIVAETPGQ